MDGPTFEPQNTVSLPELKLTPCFTSGTTIEHDRYSLLYGTYLDLFANTSVMHNGTRPAAKVVALLPVIILHLVIIQRT
jgi:hypothetical protein